MSDDLRPASTEDLADALAFALRFDGRKRKQDAAEMMARIVAKRLVEHLERSGFVVMKSRRLAGARPWALTVCVGRGADLYAPNFCTA
jgi:hypothetical protein